MPQSSTYDRTDSYVPKELVKPWLGQAFFLPNAMHDPRTEDEEPHGKEYSIPA